MSSKATKKDAEQWLSNYGSHVQILEWNPFTTKKSKLLNKNNNRIFYQSFNTIKKLLKRNPNANFGMTKKEQIENCKKKLQEEHGADNPQKIKIFKDKTEQTNLQRYGVRHTLQNKEVRERGNKTIEKKYGVKNISQSDEIKKKKEKTCLKNFGVTHPALSPIVKAKHLATLEEKYGVENVSQIEGVQEKVRQTKIERGTLTLVEGKTFREWAESETLASRTAICKSYKHGIMPWNTKARASMLEIKMRQLLDEMNITYRYNLKLPEHQGLASGFKRPDFLLTGHNLIIECDGEYWHQDREKDDRRNEAYADLGYDVLCFTGQEIMNEWNKIRDYITNLITS